MTLSGGAVRVPNKNKSLAAARATHIKVIEGTYDLLGVGNEQRGGNMFIGGILGIHPSTVNHVSIFLKKHGFLDFRYVGMPPGTPTPGKITLWTLHGSKEEAVAQLKESWERPKNNEPAEVERTIPGGDDRYTDPEDYRTQDDEDRVALAKSEREETRAIAGPEPASPFAVLRSLRKDESGALVEAARQYAGRMKLVETKLAELEAAGIHIDVSAVKLDKDDRLESISLVLPYINSMESTLHNLSEQNEALRKKMADYDLLRRDYQVLKKRFENGVAARVAREVTDTYR